MKIKEKYFKFAEPEVIIEGDIKRVVIPNLLTEKERVINELNDKFTSLDEDNMSSLQLKNTVDQINNQIKAMKKEVDAEKKLIKTRYDIKTVNNELLQLGKLLDERKVEFEKSLESTLTERGETLNDPTMTLYKPHKWKFNTSEFVIDDPKKVELVHNAIAEILGKFGGRIEEIYMDGEKLDLKQKKEYGLAKEKEEKSSFDDEKAYGA